MALTLPSGETGNIFSTPHTRIPIVRASSDTSKLHWETFRNTSLAAHKIKVLEIPSINHLPPNLSGFVESSSQDLGRFDGQSRAFRTYTSYGRRKDQSPVVSPHLLSPVNNSSNVACCILPAYTTEAMPAVCLDRLKQAHTLAVPQPELAYGFSSSETSQEETDTAPSWITVSGSVVHPRPGVVSSGAAIFAPYLTFERSSGRAASQWETSQNQCAVSGAINMRALQMLYARAWESRIPQNMLVAFSCTNDEDLAIINYHWIGHGQTYCMAPLCKFDLQRGDHFGKFLAWIEAINQWAVATLLPAVREALSSIRSTEMARSLASAAFPISRSDSSSGLARITPASADGKQTTLKQSPRTAFDQSPRRPASASEPVGQNESKRIRPSRIGIDDLVIASPGVQKLRLPHRPVALGMCGLGITTPELATFAASPVEVAHAPATTGPLGTFADTSAGPNPRTSIQSAPTLLQTCFVKPSATASIHSMYSLQEPQLHGYNIDTRAELVLRRRLDHAMDEIHDLQRQVEDLKQELFRSNDVLKEEIKSLKSVFDVVVRNTTRSILLGDCAPASSSPSSNPQTTPRSKSTLIPPHSSTIPESHGKQRSSVQADTEHGSSLQTSSPTHTSRASSISSQECSIPMKLPIIPP